MYHFEEDHEPTIEDLENKAKVFFQVIVFYDRDVLKTMFPKDQSEQIDEVFGTFESHALDTFNKADEVAIDITSTINSKFPNSEVKELGPEEQEDEFHVWVSNHEGKTFAKIGVIATDYTSATIH